MSATPPLIQNLLRPAAYPHPTRNIQLRETHISWVILTGEYAYKIKKPVRLDFLDFSTLERRQFYCEEELRLNRRYASDLYLAVVRIGGTAQSPSIDAEGQALEYAVQLRQFDARHELESLLASGAASSTDFKVFGGYLAQVHARAPRCSTPHAAAAAWATLDKNAAELQRLNPTDTLVAEVHRWLLIAWQARTALLDNRAGAGFVRDCHGDLHVGNIVQLQDELQAFDCIEFDSALRHIDVINDAAFLYMDLLARGHERFASDFFSAYLEASGDYAGVPLLRLFAVYRAMVRWKVASVLKQAREIARYRAATQALCQVSAPRLIVTCGLSGSGKTWLSEQLLGALRAWGIRSDVERKRMTGLAAHESSAERDDSIYTPEFNERVYAHLCALASTMLRAGESVTVDAAFLKARERRMFLELAQVLGIRVDIVHCAAPQTVLEERIRSREQIGDASEATVEVLRRQLSYFEPFTQTERPHVVEVDTTLPDAAERAIRDLSAGS